MKNVLAILYAPLKIRIMIFFANVQNNIAGTKNLEAERR